MIVLRPMQYKEFEIRRPGQKMKRESGYIRSQAERRAESRKHHSTFNGFVPITRAAVRDKRCRLASIAFGISDYFCQWVGRNLMER